jgi:glycine/D-amino acid oxidase-like deaminating enzyme
MFGLGASAYGGGLLTPFGRSSAHKQILASSFSLLPDLESNIGPLTFHELTAWYIGSPEAVNEHRNSFVGTAPGLASAAEIKDLYNSMPGLRLGEADVVLGPFRTRRARPTEVIARVAAKCRSSGRFSLWEGVELETWRAESGGIHLALAGAPEVSATKLVLATGAWGADVLGTSLDPSVRVKRVAACHIEAAPEPCAPLLYLGNHDSSLFPIPDERRWLFGFPSEVWDVKPEAFRPELDAADRDLADSILDVYCPGLKAHRRGGRAFYDGYTENRTPVVTRVEDNLRVIFVGGCGGSGFRLSLGLAERCFDLLDTPN